MKKFLSIVALALLLVLVGCTSNVRSNARAYVTSITAKSTEVSFKVELRDPDSELDSRTVTVRLKTAGNADVDLPLELSISQPSRTITFEDLKMDASYDVYVFGMKDDKQLQLYFNSNVFNTLKAGDEQSNPIVVTTTEEFLAMDSKKHYALGNDLDFDNESITPLFTSGTPFSGSFDGKDFTIKNINITAADDVYKSYLSVFGYASRSTIQNLKLDNVHIDNAEKPYIGIHYVGLVVSKVSNNAFILENIEITNSSITIEHNINQSVTNRNLYVGLVGGSVQGTLRNITVEGSTLNVSQNAVNGIYAGAQAATAGTYVGGAFGLVEQDKGTGIEKLAVIDSNVNFEVTQDKAGLGTGLSYVGGIFGAYRSDRNTSEVYTNAIISVTHNKHANTASDKLDTLYVGGIVGSIIKSRLNNAFFNGRIEIEASDPLNRVHTSLIAGGATTSSNMLLAGGLITVTTTSGSQVAVLSEVYPYNWANKTTEVKVLASASVEYDDAMIDLSNFDVVENVSDHITSTFILDLLS
ncbi:MAG: hypothetical protein WCZ19_01590 [Acholeplasma sp.]